MPVSSALARETALLGCVSSSSGASAPLLPPQVLSNRGRSPAALLAKLPALPRWSEFAHRPLVQPFAPSGAPVDFFAQFRICDQFFGFCAMLCRQALEPGDSVILLFGDAPRFSACTTSGPASSLRVPGACPPGNRADLRKVRSGTLALRPAFQQRPDLLQPWPAGPNPVPFRCVHRDP